MASTIFYPSEWFATNQEWNIEGHAHWDDVEAVFWIQNSVELTCLRLSDLSTSSPSLKWEGTYVRVSELDMHVATLLMQNHLMKGRISLPVSVFPRMGRISSRDKAPSLRHDSKSSRFKFWVRIFTWVYVLDISLWRIYSRKHNGRGSNGICPKKKRKINPCVWRLHLQLMQF